MVRGGVEPPTFRFSGVADTHIHEDCRSVGGCRRMSLVVAGCRRCRHRCRQFAGYPEANDSCSGLQQGPWPTARRSAADLFITRVLTGECASGLLTRIEFSHYQLGNGQIMPADVADQPSGLTLSIRDWLHATLANCTLIARCRTLQGMARVRSGQAAAWPLVSDRSVRSGLRGQA